MDRLWTFALSSVLLIGIGAASLGCGGPVCGDGKQEGPEQCDNGADNGAEGNSCSASCTLRSVPRAKIQVVYSRLKVETPAFKSFPSPTCRDLGIDRARVVVEGPTMFDEQWDCSVTSRFYEPVEPGMYRVTVTLLDQDGQPVTKSVSSTTHDVQISPLQENIVVSFLPEDYLRQDYKGTLYFRPKWGQPPQDCSAAGVTEQTILLTRPNETTPVAGMTASGKLLDGKPGACFVPSGGMSTEQIEMLPWGYYDLALTGLSGGNMTYCEKFLVFVAPGVATPEFHLAVSGYSPDAGACP